MDRQMHAHKVSLPEAAATVHVAVNRSRATCLQNAKVLFLQDPCCKTSQHTFRCLLRLVFALSSSRTLRGAAVAGLQKSQTTVRPEPDPAMLKLIFDTALQP